MIFTGKNALITVFHEDLIYNKIIISEIEVKILYLDSTLSVLPCLQIYHTNRFSGTLFERFTTVN